MHIYIYIQMRVRVHTHIYVNLSAGTLRRVGQRKQKNPRKWKRRKHRQSMFLFLRMQESIFRLRKQNPCITVTYLYSTSHSLISPRVIGRLNFLRHRKARYLRIYIFIFLTRKSRDWIGIREVEKEGERIWTLCERCLVIRGLRLILQARYKKC